MGDHQRKCPEVPPPGSALLGTKQWQSDSGLCQWILPGMPKFHRWAKLGLLKRTIYLQVFNLDKNDFESKPVIPPLNGRVRFSMVTSINGGKSNGIVMGIWQIGPLYFLDFDKVQEGPKRIHQNAYSSKTWHDKTRHDMTWHDMTWHDMTWRDVTWQCHTMTLTVFFTMIRWKTWRAMTALFLLTFITPLFVAMVKPCHCCHWNRRKRTSLKATCSIFPMTSTDWNRACHGWEWWQKFSTALTTTVPTKLSATPFATGGKWELQSASWKQRDTKLAPNFNCSFEV